MPQTLLLLLILIFESKQIIVILHKHVHKSLPSWAFSVTLLANWLLCTTADFAVDKDACCLLSGSLQLQQTDLLFGHSQRLGSPLQESPSLASLAG